MWYQLGNVLHVKLMKMEEEVIVAVIQTHQT